jgi:hypothetical protein
MANYLLIQNKGEAPVEAFTLLGASMSRNDDGLIGQFGSGAKLAITTLLRKGLKVIVYCGLTRMEFKTKTITINDGLGERQERQVYVQFGGTSTKKQDLGWTIGFGALDWQNEDMAAREFVANAIDRTIKQGDNVKGAYTDCDLAVQIVPESKRKAQKGYTRVFVEANETLADYVDDLPHRFLHFTNVPMGTKILPKLGDRKKAQIYLNGVWVRELESSDDSLFDYNFTPGEVTIDESRNLDEYYARAAVGRAFRDASVEELVALFQALSRNEKCLETSLDPCYVKPGWQGASDKQKEAWRDAWERVNGKAVACGGNQDIVGEFARKKGYDLGVVHETHFLSIMSEYDIPMVENVVDDNERKGRVVTAPSFKAVDAVNMVWEWIEGAELLDLEKCSKPHVNGFNEAPDAGGECLGYYDPQTKEIYLRNDLEGGILLETALEECIHYATGASDCSRDIQSFAFRMVVQYLK